LDQQNLQAPQTFFGLLLYGRALAHLPSDVGNPIVLYDFRGSDPGFYTLDHVTSFNVLFYLIRLCQQTLASSIVEFLFHFREESRKPRVAPN
jgi:hypothetical protein